MVGTPGSLLSPAQLLQEFADGQSSGSITPSRVRDLITSILAYLNAQNPNSPVIVNPSPPSVTTSAQNFTTPAGPAFTSLAQPFGVQLANPNSNVLDWTFGYNTPGATIKTRADLDTQTWYRDLFDSDGQPYNFVNHFRVYPAYLSDGVTRDPRDLHPIYADRIDIIARSWMTGDTDAQNATVSGLSGSFPGAPYVGGFLRPATPILPNMYMEICCKWPSNRWAWPVFWLFTGTQSYGSNQAYFGTPNGPNLEIDIFDGYQLDNAPYTGQYIPAGTPLYGADSYYGNPDDLYLHNRPPYTVRYDGSGGASISQFATTAASNPTNGYHYYALDWRGDTLTWIFDGIPVKRRRLSYPAVYSTANIEGTTTPSNLLGTMIPMFLQIDHQLCPVYNSQDVAALAANSSPIYNAYSVKSVRVWNSTTVNDPPSKTTVAVSVTPPQPYSGAQGTQPPIYGDVPNITTASVILNIDASATNPLVDQAGTNDVQLIGDGALVANQINSKAAFTSTQGMMSIIGPAIAQAQGTGQFALFMVVKNANAGSSQVLAQFVRAMPQTNAYQNRISLMCSGFQAGGMVGDFQSSGSHYSASIVTPTGAYVSASTDTASGNVDLVSMTKTLASDGTVTIGQGYSQHHSLPVTSGGLPASVISGFTELVIGAGRDYYGPPTLSFNATIGQILMLAIPDGGALSSGDRATVETYLQTKWATTTASEADYASVPQSAGFVPGSTVVTFTGSPFVWFNQGSASFVGGSTLSVSDPASTNPTANCLVTAMSGSAATYTATFVGNCYNTSYYKIGLVLATSGSNTLTTFMISGADTQYWKISKYTSLNNETDYVTGSSPWATNGTSTYFRITYDGTNYSFYANATSGTANNWVLMGGSSYTATTLGNPTHVGFFLFPQDNYSTGLTANMNVTKWTVGSSVNAQGAV